MTDPKVTKREIQVPIKQYLEWDEDGTPFVPLDILPKGHKIIGSVYYADGEGFFRVEVDKE